MAYTGKMYPCLLRRTARSGAFCCGFGTVIFSIVHNLLADSPTSSEGSEKDPKPQL